MNINPNEYFLANDNLEMLWELLTEESSFKNKSPNNRQNIYDVFCNNLVSFNDVEKQKGVNLMNMNKKYVMSMISYINKMDTDELQKNTLNKNMVLKFLRVMACLKLYLYLQISQNLLQIHL